MKQPKKKGRNSSSSSDEDSDRDVEVIKVWNSRSRGGNPKDSKEEVPSKAPVPKVEESELASYNNAVRGLSLWQDAVRVSRYKNVKNIYLHKWTTGQPRNTPITNKSGRWFNSQRSCFCPSRGCGGSMFYDLTGHSGHSLYPTHEWHRTELIGHHGC